MKTFKRIATVLGISIPIVAAVFFALYSQEVFDWWKLRNYQPSAEIEQLSKTSSLSEHGERLFYIHDPALLDKANFQNSCTVGEATIVLGCYISNERIFVYDVADERLEGVEQVTAAHEMLHAAYDRLSPNEKDRINGLLDEAFNRITDERILSNIATYRDKDPSVVPNELHSILGTELRELPKDLEEYYAQYFDDRMIVVGYAEKYASEFEKREKQIEAFDEQLTQLNGEITRIEAEMSEQNKKLQDFRSEIESMDPFDGSYNRSVASYNSQVKSYNNKVNTVSSLVDRYNVLVEERNAIAFEERQLVEAIDTRASEL